MIKEIEKDDLIILEDICVKTATGIYKEKPLQTKLLFMDYYVLYGVGYKLICGENVVGYAVGSEDYKRYVQVYESEFLPKLKAVDKGESIRKKLELMLDKLLGAKYPAHLHIDILEEYCGKGNGTKLITALIDRFKADNVKGVWLGVDVKNERAISFYRKIGFIKHRLLGAFGIYVKKLND